jgi:hypothetical protein
MRLRVLPLCSRFGIALALLLATTTVMPGCSGGGSGGSGSGALSVWIESEPDLASAGDTTQASLVISDPSGVAGLDLNLTFDASLLSVSSENPVSRTALTGDFAIACNDQTAGSLSVFMAHATGLTGRGSEELLKITFVVDPGVPSGTRIPVSVASLRVYDNVPTEIRLDRVSGGEISVQ